MTFKDKELVLTRNCPKCKSTDIAVSVISEVATTYEFVNGISDGEGATGGFGGKPHEVHGHCHSCDKTWRFKDAQSVDDVSTEQ